MRVVVYAAPRTGNHFTARSIARSAGIRYGIARGHRELPRAASWVITTHAPYQDGDDEFLAASRAVAIFLDRNPLDHALSFYDHPNNPNGDAFITAASSDEFLGVREQMRSYPRDRLLSYDLLATRDPAEADRLRAFVNLPGPVLYDEIEQTRQAAPMPMRYGQPGRWRQVLTDSTARVICDALGEPFPSWTLDVNHDWQPPTPMPPEGGPWAWDEETLSWVEVTA